MPFGKAEAIAYAELLADRAHALGLAVAQKNTLELSRRESRGGSASTSRSPRSAAATTSAGDYRRVFGDRVIAIEYRRRDFRRACRAVGQQRLRGAARPRA